MGQTRLAEDAKNDHELRQLTYMGGTSQFSVTDAIERVGFGKFQWILCAISLFSWLASAMEIMMLAVLSPSLECEWGLNKVELALCTTVIFVGWMVGSPVWGRVCDVYGRRKGLMACSAVGFVFGVLTMFSPSFYVFLGARFAIGFAVAGLTQSVTLTSEFLPAAGRAKWLTILKCGWALGAALEAGVAAGVLPTLGWRWLAAFSAIPMAMHGLFSWWLPESVRFDVAQGRMVEAMFTLERIAISNGKRLPSGELVAEKAVASSSMKELFNKDLCRSTIQLWIIWTSFGFLYYGLAIYTYMLTRATPTNEVTTLAPELFEAAENATEVIAETINTNISEVVTGACRQMTTWNYMSIIITTMSEVPGYILTMYLIDWIGRRATFAAGFGAFAACAGVLIFSLPKVVTVGTLFVGRSAIASVYQIGYVYTAEVYPVSLRAQGLGIASSFARVGAMVAPLIAEMLSAISITLPAIVFTVVGVVGVIFSVLLPIETKGR